MIMSESTRERFCEIAKFKRPGELFMMSMFNTLYWEPTIRRWRKEGAPEGIVPGPDAVLYGPTLKQNRFLHFDRMEMMWQVHSGIGYWEGYKKRLDPHSPQRWPDDWGAYVEECNNRDYALGLYAGSFFGFLREWMGLEKLLLTFYDDPALIEEMMDHMAPPDVSWENYCYYIDVVREIGGLEKIFDLSA
jgi:hypothetical protein